tara:strand:+ start:27 stop:350 length:324 start_codon:yes stop_codon:yes gene_type:complete
MFDAIDVSIIMKFYSITYLSSAFVRSTSIDVIDRSNASTGSTSIDAIDAIERSNAIERSDAIDGIDRTRSIDGAPFPSRRSRKRGRPTSERRSIDLAIRTKEIGCLP